GGDQGHLGEAVEPAGVLLRNPGLGVEVLHEPGRGARFGLEALPEIVDPDSGGGHCADAGDDCAAHVAALVGRSHAGILGRVLYPGNSRRCSLRMPPSQRSSSLALFWKNWGTWGWGRMRTGASASPSTRGSATMDGWIASGPRSVSN